MSGRQLSFLLFLLQLTASACSPGSLPFASWFEDDSDRPPGPPPRYTDLEARIETRRGGKSTIVAADGSLLAELRLERCDPVPADALPEHVIDAFAASEDPTECDPLRPGTMRPLIVALEGAWSPVDNVWHSAGLCTSMREALFGPPTESSEYGVRLLDGEYVRLEPRPLLAAYANVVDMGGGDFGVEVASKSWFGRPVQEIDPGQAALLAAVAAFPDARANPVALRKARDRILARMVDRGTLSPIELEVYRRGPVPKPKRWHDRPGVLPPLVDAAEAELRGYLAGSPVLRRGVKVHTAFDPALQKAARKATERVFKLWAKNRKKESEELTAMIEKLNTEMADLSIEDAEKSLEELEIRPGSRMEMPEDAPSVSLFALEPDTGLVRVLFDQEEDPLDKKKKKLKERRPEPPPLKSGALTRKRQPGSSWKPFVYATAIEQGMTQADAWTDQPLTYTVKDEEWSPKNHEEKYMKGITSRWALAQSLNSVAIQIIFKVGPENVAKLANRLGITSQIRAVPALALGTPPVTLSELVSSYAAFPSGGLKVEPRYIAKIEDADGHEIALPGRESGPRVLDPRVAYVMVDMLREVTSTGTAWPAKRMPFQVGGKTGTTNESKDAWFIGFSTKLVAGVWVGYEEKDALGGHETGGSLALPIWMEVMNAAAKSNPPTDFPVPEGIEFEKRAPWNGHRWEKGKLMALVAPTRKPCNELPPEGARPFTEEGEEEKPIPPEWIREWKKRKKRPGCVWTPVGAPGQQKGAAESTGTVDQPAALSASRSAG